MRIRTATAIASTFVAIAVTANARLSEPLPAAARHAAPTYHVGASHQVRQKASANREVERAEPPLEIAPLDTTDPWTGRPLDIRRSFARIDDRDPWTGDVIGSRVSAQLDTTDPWR